MYNSQWLVELHKNLTLYWHARKAITRLLIDNSNYLSVRAAIGVYSVSGVRFYLFRGNAVSLLLNPFSIELRELVFSS